jgi:integrase
LRAYVGFHRRRVAEDGVSDDRLFLCHGGHRRGGEETIGELLSADGVKPLFRRASTRLGIKVHPHKLRRTFSTDFLNDGGRARTCSGSWGRETPQLSLYYAHVTNADAVERQKSNSVVDRQLRREVRMASSRGAAPRKSRVAQVMGSLS